MFSEHKDATMFVDDFADKCAHYTYKKQLLHQHPCLVDLGDKKIRVFKTRLTPRPNVPAELFHD